MQTLLFLAELQAAVGLALVAWGLVLDRYDCPQPVPPRRPRR